MIRALELVAAALGRRVPGELQPRLAVAELCGCGHLGAAHDPDLGCTVDGPGAVWCSCRRLRCRCPLTPPGAR